MIFDPISCVHYPSGPSMPSSYALALHFSSLEFIFPFLILRANFLLGELGVHLYCRTIHSHLFCHSVFITLPIHSFNQSLYPLIHLPTHLSVQLHTYSNTQVCIHPSAHPSPAYPLAPSNHLSINLSFIHLSSLTHPSIYSLIHPPTYPIYPCI